MNSLLKLPMFTLIGSLILIFKEQSFVKHRIESVATHQLFVKFISLTTRCRQRRMRIKHPSNALVKHSTQNTYFYLVFFISILSSLLMSSSAMAISRDSMYLCIGAFGARSMHPILVKPNEAICSAGSDSGRHA